MPTTRSVTNRALNRSTPGAQAKMIMTASAQLETIPNLPCTAGKGAIKGNVGISTAEGFVSTKQKGDQNRENQQEKRINETMVENLPPETGS